MPLTPGTRLGHYEILSAIGAGGMGEVYRARDPRLDREVAIKVLPEGFASDPDRLARFEREAKAIAALSHPHILAIHEFGSEGQTLFAVMELLHGETLRQRLMTGPLGLRKALEYASQMAKGLAAAHEKGIIHRDLKPENVFVTAEGHVKLLDFGLARQGMPAFSGTDRTVSVGTEPGVVMGTAGYMSPEQVRGSVVDHRGDIFSFGAVLYEMLSGRRAFSRGTAAETMSAILNEDPPELTESGRAIPAAVDHVVRHCLEKRPEERFQSARDLAFALQHFESGISVVGRKLPETRRIATLWPLTLVLLGATAFFVGRWTAPPSDSVSPWRTAHFSRVTTSQEAELWPNLAPDGKSAIYASAAGGNMDIYVQRIGGHNATNLTSDSPDVDDQPAFSPDATRIAFHSTRDGGGIFLMGATGESVRRLSDFGHTPAWSPDGRFIVVSDATFANPSSRPRAGKLWVLSVGDGSRRELPTGDAIQPSWSPDGSRIAYWGVLEGGQRDIWTIAANGSTAPVRVTDDEALDWNPVWAPEGGALYFSTDRSGTMNLARVPIEQKTGRVLGPVESIVVPADSAGPLSVSHDGKTMLYGTERMTTTLYAASFDSSRERFEHPPRAVLQGAQVIDYIDVSPDGQWIAFGSKGRQEDLFIIGADGSGIRQLTDDPHRDRGPRWSPDGSQLAFYSNRGGPYGIWSIRPDGSRLEPLSAIAKEYPLVRPTWSPDGGRLIAAAAITVRGVQHLDLSRPLETRASMLPSVPPGSFVPQAWSPDGRVVAGTYEDGPDSNKIFLFAYPDSFRVSYEAPSRVWEGSMAWLQDARRLLFTSRGAGITMIDTATGKTREIMPSPGGLTEFPVLAKALRGSLVAFVEMRTEGDLWLMQR